MTEFKVKSAEELAAMDSRALADYMFLKLAHDNEQLKSLIAQKASPEQVNQVRDEIVAAHNATLKQVDDLLEVVKQQGLAIGRQLRDTSPKAERNVKSLLIENRDKLREISQGKISSFEELTYKAPGNMTIAGQITGEIPQAQRLPGLDVLPLRPLSLISLVTRSGIGRTTVSWAYMVDRDGNPAPTAEGGTKPLIDFSSTVGTESAAKYTARIRVSMEMLDDIDFMETEIRTDLFDRLLRDIEEDLYDGSGTATPLNLRGIRTVAQAFAAPAGMAGAVDNPDMIDVLAAARVQALLDNMPAFDTVLLNPVDIALLETVKVSTTDRRRVMSLYQVGETLRYKGATLVESQVVDQGDFLAGYMPYATLYDYMGPVIKVGLDGNDFSENMVTILAEWRGMAVVKHNRRPAFIAGNLATAKAALAVT